jgi:hypothetical protein
LHDLALGLRFGFWSRRSSRDFGSPGHRRGHTPPLKSWHLFQDFTGCCCETNLDLAITVFRLHTCYKMSPQGFSLQKPKFCTFTFSDPVSDCYFQTLN